jgi:hypothetical protein
MRVARLVVLLVLASCADPISIEKQLVATATVSPDVIQVGEPATVTITVKNVSGRTHDVGQSECPPAFEILEADGTVLGPIRMLCNAVGRPPRKLASGEVFTRTYTWRGEREYAWRGERSLVSAHEYLAKGTYLIRPWIGVRGGALPAEAVPIVIN